MPGSTSPNIVIIAIDSLRADHLGCYGYHLNTSPAIDALAGESVVFDRAFAAAIPTMPSFTTLYTGLHPYRHGIVSHVSRRLLSPAIRMLPQLAQQRGYLTAACDNLVVQGDGRGAWFARGYDYYAGFVYKPFSNQSAWITDRALTFIEQRAATQPHQPLLLFLHYWDPHSPYGPLPPYDTLHYRPGSGPVDLRDVYAIAPHYYEAFLGEMRLRRPDDYAYVVAQYDGEISQVDAQVARLVAALKEQDMWDNTILLLLSDHGEAFGEGGFYFDHHGLYDAVTRVALLLRAPGRRPGRIGAMVSTEDLLPTLCDLADLPAPPYELTGVSAHPLLEGTARSIRDRVVSAESSRQASLALRTERWKLIVPITADASRRPLPDVYGRPRSPDPLLFDLQEDPQEQRNLSREQPDVLEALRRELECWRVGMAAATGEPDPIQAQGLTLPYDQFMARILARSREP
jgi:arylsulfatase A-like enzyme